MFLKNSVFSFMLAAMGIAASFSTSCKAAGTERPRLVVGIVVDQMRWDYLMRYADKWGEGGFRRLMESGYSYDNTYLCYVPSVTAVGHASIYSGTTPAVHGIAGNDFYMDNKKVYCTDDHTVKTVGSNTAAGEMSPRNMLSTTIGDQLKLAYPKARVVGVSLKDRAAILPAGHSADAAYWWDDKAGVFITSSYYMDSLPKWLNDFNATHHRTTDVRYVPDGISLTADLAIAAIDGYALGKGEATDMLTVSFSSTDYVGHKFGTMAPETEDVYLKTDKELARLFAYLDENIGRDHYLVFLTADHAAAHNSDEMAQRRIPSGEWSEEEALKNVNEHLKVRFAVESDLVKSLIEYRFYLDDDAIVSSHLDREIVKQELIRYLESDPRVMQAIDYKKVHQMTVIPAISDRIVMGYNAKRSGDVIAVMQPGVYAVSQSSFKKGTTHGVWNPYDSHIPLLFYGWHICKGRSSESVQVIDIATTVCSMLDIQQPNGSVGRVLR